MDLNLNGKVVVMTGGTAGIGKAAALEFAREGCTVAVVARSKEKLAAMKKKTDALGYSFEYASADVADIPAMEAFAQALYQKHGHIDVWVNNAGVAINRDCTEFTEEEYDRIMNTNLKSVFFCSRIAAKYMKLQKTGGVILNASSFVVNIPHANGAVYAASKAGVSSLTRTFAACLAPYNIRVLGYIPGMIVSDMSSDFIEQNREKFVRDISMHRLGVPEDLAKPIVFMASDAAGYMTGFDIEITGGKFAVQACDYGWKRLEEIGE